MAVPWQFNPTLGGEFIYNPTTDEVVLKDGRRFARPSHIPRASLASAAYAGPLDFQYTGSPPNASNYVHQAGLGSRAGSSALPIRAQLSGLSAGMAPRQDGRTQRSGHARSNLQTIAARTETPVVFARATESQANRREEVRPPGVRERGINIGVDALTGTLFPNFKLRSSDFFAVGRVFQVLWSEPAGGASIVTRWEPGIVLNQYRERVFSKVRRFVVIRSGTNYCTALPINSYGGQGVAKRGVNKSEHVVVWSQGPDPPHPARDERPMRGEESMQRVPIRIDPDSPAEHLDSMSRLNLAGVTTVQHNIKAKSVGKVNARYLRALIDQFSVVWGPQQVPVPRGLAAPAASREDAEDDDDEDEDEDEDDDAQSESDNDDDDDEDAANDDDDQDSDDDRNEDEDSDDDEATSGVATN